MTTLDDDLAAVNASLADFVVIKQGLTAILTQYITQYNANASRLQLSTTLTAYVNQFNLLTAKTNELQVNMSNVNRRRTVVNLTAAPFTISVVDNSLAKPVLGVSGAVGPVIVPVHLSGASYFASVVDKFMLSPTLGVSGSAPTIKTLAAASYSMSVADNTVAKPVLTAR